MRFGAEVRVTADIDTLRADYDFPVAQYFFEKTGKVTETCIRNMTGYVFVKFHGSKGEWCVKEEHLEEI